jgi:hypothetical protein
MSNEDVASGDAVSIILRLHSLALTLLGMSGWG